MAAWGRIESGRLKLDAVVASPKGDRWIRLGCEGKPDQPEHVGRKLVEELLAKGAEEILKDPLPVS